MNETLQNAAQVVRRVALALVVVLLVVFSGRTIGDWLNTDGHIAAIEQLRTDVDRVSRDEGDGVMALAASANMQIARRQANNKNAWIGFFISDRWEKVKPISVRRWRREEPPQPQPQPKPDTGAAVGAKIASYPAPDDTQELFGYTPNREEAERIIKELGLEKKKP